jgi:hypothetical protein
MPANILEICETRARSPEVPGILSGSATTPQLLEAGSG